MKTALRMAGLCLVLGWLLVGAGCVSASTCGREGGKEGYLVILQADVDRHEGMARALHALLYSRELLEAGYPVTLVFDGAGTAWARRMREPADKLHASFQELLDRGVVEEVCDFCSGAFKVKEALQGAGAPLKGEYGGHPSVATWVAKGYRVIVL